VIYNWKAFGALILGKAEDPSMRISLAMNYFMYNESNIPLFGYILKHIIPYEMHFFIVPFIYSLLFIFIYLKYIKPKIVEIYTNNNGPQEWAKRIIKYFETKIDSKLIDQIIAAFKVNGKHIEICRTTHSKTHDDFIRCTKLPQNAEICFLDDTFHPGMANEHIYYINIKPYYYDLPFEEMFERFIDSDIGKKYESVEDLKKNMLDHWNLYKYSYIQKDQQEYEFDKIVGKHIISHLQTFFNDKPKRGRSIKKKNNQKYIGNKRNIRILIVLLKK
jgi:hypothetical protein